MHFFIFTPIENQHSIPKNAIQDTSNGNAQNSM